MIQQVEIQIAARGIVDELRAAQRPVLIFGQGMRHAAPQAREFARMTGVPVCPTWGALDALWGSVGGFGTHGTRAANFAVQNADYILCVGTRLDTKATGSPASTFAPKARIAMVDIDPAELRKMAAIGRTLHKGVIGDALAFMESALRWARPSLWKTAEWCKRINEWKARYPVVDPAWREAKEINPYVLMEMLGGFLHCEDIIVSDTGCSLPWIMQGYPFKGETFIHAFNQTPMGYGLPAAIGAAFACPDQRVVCVTGDGGLGVHLPELSTLARHRLNVKVIVLDNRGHGMCRQTQRQWMGAEYFATSETGGLSLHDFDAYACAAGIHVRATASHIDAARILLGRLLEEPGPAVLTLSIPSDLGVIPQARFGAPIHDQDPALPREEIEAIMENS